jgi:hypothetical protein
MSVGKRRAPLRRSPLPPRQPAKGAGGLRPLKAIKRKPRSKKKTERIYGSKARARWISMLPCVGCGRMPTADVPNVNAHTESGHGTGYKADAETIAPMCHACHRKYDEHKAPFDAEDARDAMKIQAAFVAERWTRMGEVAS